MYRVIKSPYSIQTMTVPSTAISMRERSAHLRSDDFVDELDSF